MSEENGDKKTRGKGKPLTIEELQAKLKSEYEAQGFDVDIVTKVKGGAPATDPTPVVTPTDPPITRKPENKPVAGMFQVDVAGDDDDDTFECGACGAPLDEAFPVCPKCGAALQWEG